MKYNLCRFMVVAFLLGFGLGGFPVSDAAAGAYGAGGSDTARVHYLDQGWTAARRTEFYFTPQGSRIIPLTWFLALERADGQGPFAADENLTRYGFIPAAGYSTLNPHKLPIGLAIDPVDQPITGRSLGLTCAACHTTDVTVEGKVIRIDGGQALLDFDSFYRDLSAAVSRTRFDQAVFGRFAAKVLKSATPDADAVEKLAAAFALYEAELAGEATIRRPLVESGFGRVDALTQIINALSVTAQRDASNLRAVASPTSYPSLWLTPQLEFVQWNPIAASPIGRNGGEVLGVFAETNLSNPYRDPLETSALIPELHALEVWVEELAPPPWDEAVFGPIDRTLAADGKALYQQHCEACHTAPPYRMTDPSVNIIGKSFIEIGRVDFREIGTDPYYMLGLLKRFVRTNTVTAPLNDGKPLVIAPRFFLNIVVAVTSKAMNDLGYPPELQMALHGYRFHPPAEPGGPPIPYSAESVTNLKAGPLPGIWATGPYLHNGSVPTVYELLSPEAERRPVFWTGAQELDRDRLGFVSSDAPGRFTFDTSIAGNHNTGHLYPAEGLTHEQRLAVIEFLKTL